MKKIILLSISAFILCTNTKAQVVTDTVSTGAGYINDVWYSLENDELGATPSDNWDIAFSTTGQSSTSILINSEHGVELWSYPSDVSGWTTVDSSTYASWISLYNSVDSWNGGAFVTTADATDPFDVGWGNYNMATHAVTGDSIYIIKLTDGTYKKLMIESLTGSTFSFKYANIDGTNEVSATLDKTNYSNKLFGYYSIVNDVALDREPSSVNNWDLVFKKQTVFIPTAYGVTSVLINNGVEVAKVSGVPDATTYNDWSSQTFSSEINTVGGNWKSFNMTTYQYEIDDSLVYFIKDLPGDVWKLVFTGFGGSANGNYIFTKEKISLAGLSDYDNSFSINTFKVYPNPASTNNSVSIVYNAATPIKKGTVKVYNTLGKQVLSSTLPNNVGLNTKALSTAALKSGLYFVVFETATQRLQQKLIIQ